MFPEGIASRYVEMLSFVTCKCEAGALKGFEWGIIMFATTFISSTPAFPKRHGIATTSNFGFGYLTPWWEWFAGSSKGSVMPSGPTPWGSFGG